MAAQSAHGQQAWPPPRVLSVGQHVEAAVKGRSQYWTETNGHIVVASSLPALVSSMRDPQLDLAALAAKADGRAGIWLSPFLNVNRLTFGHRLTATVAGPRVTRWLRPQESEPPMPQTPGGPAAVMRAAIADAVDAATAGQDGATVALSGGLDSTTVLALAAGFEHLHDGLRAYCAAVDETVAPLRKGRFADEWPLASAAAAHVGVHVEPLINDEGFNWLDACEDFHRRNLMPVPTPANMWWLSAMERRAARNGHRVILTGQSGNATFSNGRPNPPSPLLSDGTWARPGGVRGLRRRWRRRRQTTFGNIVRALPVQMPDHVLDMDPWTRWCLAEPPAPRQGAWTGADVEWLDPLGSPQVITAAMSLPREAWGEDGSHRHLARQVGVGLLPDEVRLCRERGIQGMDLPRHIADHPDAYAEAIERVRQSPSAQQFLDTDRLLRATALLGGDLRSAEVFQRSCVQPLAVGLFAAWWDEQVRAKSASW